MANPPDLPGVKANLKDQLAFTCTHEADKLPKLDPEADKLFKRARWIYKQNMLKEDPAKYTEAERLYRIASAYGHYKAQHNLLLMFVRGKSTSIDRRVFAPDLAEDMIKRGIPQGYYDMGMLLGKGFGVEQDESASMKYIRKAADLGNPEAQYYVGSKLFDMSVSNPVPFEIGREMKKCAAEQGHAKAALETAVDVHDDGKFAEAVKYYQLAVKAGNSQAAYKFEKSFLVTDPSNQLHYLALPKDEERSIRYGKLQEILSGYDYLNATVDEIDEIVPLPPAKLPPWDGKIKWVKEWEKGVPPPLPSEERIAEMARAKGLDPKTGYPLEKD
jgi:TPR repeat protein